MSMFKVSRRELLKSAASISFLTLPELFIPHSNAKAFWRGKSADPAISGWNVLLMGCGGLKAGFDTTPDGSVAVRSDVGDCYQFSGTISQFVEGL
jgi:hypothetical protein